MPQKEYNRLKVVLAEQNKAGQWLADKLNVSRVTVSRWVTNTSQPSVENLVTIAKVLKVDVTELLNHTK